MSDPYKPPQTDGDQAEQIRLPAVAISALLALIVFGERFAYYGTRAVMVVWFITGLGMADAEAYGWYATMTTAIIFAPFLGGTIALVTGPYPLALLGSAVMVLAFASLTAVPTIPLFASIALLAFGQGLQKPAVYAIAGSQFRGVFSNTRTATFVLLYGAVNLGAASSSVLAPYAHEFGWHFAFIPAALAMVGVTALCTIVWALDWNRPAEPPLNEAAARRFAASLPLLPLGAAFWMGVAASSEFLFTAPPMWLFNVNPVVVLLSALVLFPVLLILQAAEIEIPAMPVVGLSLLLLLPGIAILLIPGAPENTGILIASVVLLAVPEIALGAFVMSRITGDLPTRLSTMLIAGWMASAYVGNAIVSALSPLVGSVPMVIASIVICLVAAVVAFGLWKPLDWIAFDRDEIANDA